MDNTLLRTEKGKKIITRSLTDEFKLLICRGVSLVLVTAESRKKAVTAVHQQTTEQCNQFASYRREVSLYLEVLKIHQETRMVKPILSCQRHAINVITSSVTARQCRWSSGYEPLPLHPPHLKAQRSTKVRSWLSNTRASIL